MIKIEKTDTYGWEAAVRGMRNPLNSWDKSDSIWHMDFESDYFYAVGKNDLSLMKRLVKAGSDHSKFMRMITVTCDITAPLYWWKEFDTYKVGTVANSTSTMHTIHKRDFIIEDFSCERLNKYNLKLIQQIIGNLNIYREIFVLTKDPEAWIQMIQLLPSSYNQLRTVQLNYAVLRNIYHARKNHKLKEWHNLCRWIETLPYSELITEVFDK